MGQKTVTKLLGVGGVILSTALMIGTAWATNMIPPANTCTGLNCGARLIHGTVLQLNGIDSHPWVAQVYSPAQRCLRLAVTSEHHDFEMVVTSPNGDVFRNDDGNVAPCPNCPVVKIASTPRAGWYTVSIAHFLGLPVSGNFTMGYSTYPAGNPNCGNPTIPVTSPLEPSLKNQKSPTETQPLLQEEGAPAAQ